MVQEFRAGDEHGGGFTEPVRDWHAYASIARFGDWDNLTGDELSVPIIYEPG